jgi:hypothetical protein
MLDCDWSSDVCSSDLPDGSTILTMVSDDNGNWFQRTVLLRFRLVGAP